MSTSQTNSNNTNTNNGNTTEGSQAATDSRLSGSTVAERYSGSTVASADYTAVHPNATSYNSADERVPVPGPQTITSTELRSTLASGTTGQRTGQPTAFSSLNEQVESTATTNNGASGGARPIPFGSATRGGHSAPSHARNFSGSSAAWSDRSSSPLQFHMDSDGETNGSSNQS